MISALAEGAVQSLLPCSWTLLGPAFLIGIGGRRPLPAAASWAAVIIGAWVLVAGWLVPPLWVAGLCILGGSLLWWRRGLGAAAGALIGLGAAWAWRPCVGAALGTVLNGAQVDPVGAVWGLAAFLTGVIGIGVLLGFGARRLARDRGWIERAGAVALSVLGVVMVAGWYPWIASELARWSFSLWA